MISMLFLTFGFLLVEATSIERDGLIERVSHHPGPGVFDEESIASTEFVNVYVGDYVMKRWKVQTSWELYHGGLIFSPADDGSKNYLIEYVAVNEEDMFHYLMPSSFRESVDKKNIPENFHENLIIFIFRFFSLIFSPFFNQINPTPPIWENYGKLRLSNSLPDRYTDKTWVGRIETEKFLALRNWAENQWIQSGDRFDLFTVVNENDSENWEVLLRAKICHEFVEAALDELNRMGACVTPSKTLYKDVVVMYASKVSEVDISRFSEKRELERTLAVFASRGIIVAGSFKAGRDFLGDLRDANMRMVVHSGGKLWWVQLQEGLGNYCYVQDRVRGCSPEIDSNLHTPKICLLPDPRKTPIYHPPQTWLQIFARLENQIDRFWFNQNRYLEISSFAITLFAVFALRIARRRKIATRYTPS